LLLTRRMLILSNNPKKFRRQNLLVATVPGNHK